MSFNGNRKRVPFNELTGRRTITIYGQQEVVKDLIKANLERGVNIQFETTATCIEGIDTTTPKVHYQQDGEERILECDFVAGCDGYHGIGRKSLPHTSYNEFVKEYPFSWLGILAHAAPSSDELIYAYHERGFALHSLRSPKVSRLYLQVDNSDKVEHWTDDQIWDELEVRLSNKNGFRLGGALGTLHGMMGKGLMVAETMSEQLGLNMPSMPWHTQRDRLSEVVTTLGILMGNLGKIAKDISLLMQTEVAEVFEPSGAGKGGSSTMPHKRNPVGCIAILANVQREPFLVATMLNAMVQDHERATGAWHAEWETISAVVLLTSVALHKSVEVTCGLEVDSEQMLRNIEINKGLIFAENVSLALAEKIGKQDAHQLIEKCCHDVQTNEKHLKEIILGDHAIMQYLTPAQLEELFDPAKSIGVIEELINRILSK